MMVVVLCSTFKEGLMFNLYAYGLWITMVYFAHSGCYTLTPLATSDIFGSKVRLSSMIIEILHIYIILWNINNALI